MSKDYTLNPNLSEADRYKAFAARLLMHCFKNGDRQIAVAMIIAATDLGMDVSEDIKPIVDNIVPTLDLLDAVEDSEYTGINMGGMVYEIVSNFTKDGSMYEATQEAKDKGFEIFSKHLKGSGDANALMSLLSQIAERRDAA